MIDAFDSRTPFGLNLAQAVNFGEHVHADCDLLVGGHRSSVSSTQGLQRLLGHRLGLINRTATDHFTKFLTALVRRTALAVRFTVGFTLLAAQINGHFTLARSFLVRTRSVFSRCANNLLPASDLGVLVGKRT
jgi:hypothetical protein